MIEKKFLQNLGAIIKRRRSSKEITADEAARCLGLTITTQFRRESGVASMPVEDLVRYAIVFGCKPSDLIRETDEALQSPGSLVAKSKK